MVYDIDRRAEILDTEALANEYLERRQKLLNEARQKPKDSPEAKQLEEEAEELMQLVYQLIKNVSEGKD